MLSGVGRSSGTFTTTTAHVEFDSLGRFFKIEFAEKKPEPEPAPAAEPSESKAIYLNVMGLVSVDGRMNEEAPKPTYVHAGVLRIPFLTVLEFDSHNQFMKHDYIDANLFALVDATYLGKIENGNPHGMKTDYARVTVIDSIVFTGYRNEFDAPQRKEWEILDIPFATTLSHTTDKDSNRWKFLNVPFLWVYRHEREGDHAETHVVDGPGVALYKSDRRSGAHVHWTFGDLLLVDVMESSRHRDTSHFGFVESFNLIRGPLLSVYSSDVERDMRGGESGVVSSRQFLRLPLLGPVFGTWKDSRGGHFAPLPSVFVSKKNRPKAFRAL